MIDSHIKNLIKVGDLIVVEIEHLNRLKENNSMET